MLIYFALMLLWRRNVNQRRPFFFLK